MLSAVAFCVALGFGILAPAIPVFAKSFDVTATQAASVISVFALLRLIGAVPAGWLVDRIGERSVLVTGLSIVAVSSALAGFSTTFNQLLGFRGVGGLGSAMFTVSAMALLLRSVGPGAARSRGGRLPGRLPARRRRRTGGRRARHRDLDAARRSSSTPRPSALPSSS